MIAIADALLHAFDHRAPMAPITDSDPDFTVAKAYDAQALLTARRKARGAHVIGLKAGFTNAAIWAEYGISAPILGPVFDTSLIDGTLSTAPFLEPRIEPEVVLKLRTRPDPAMDDAALLACVEAIAPGFEIVQSPFPGWRCGIADAVAAGAMHGALALGRWQDTQDLAPDTLRDFTVSLLHDDIPTDIGHATTLLGSGPLAVLRHVLALPGAETLDAGALLSTGTITRAFPARPGLWTARFSDLPLPDLTLRLT
ncbi:MAG: fumarylacetoacetate hydrolase family protein [Pararhodobacter sp.]